MKENEELHQKVEAKDLVINDYERRLRAESKQDYNVLNAKLNEMLKENTSLKQQLETKDYKKRTPLKPVKAETQSSILNMLNNKHTRSQSSKESPIKISNIRQTDSPKGNGKQSDPIKFNLYNLQSSQNQPQTSESSEYVPTQFTMDEDDFEAQPPNVSNPAGDTYRHEENVPLFNDTVDFRVPILSSPTVDNKEPQYTGGSQDSQDSQDFGKLQSSPSQRKDTIAVKKEQSDDSIEILDSQDEIDSIFNMKYPTPKTTTKFQTPINIPKKLDFKKSLLHTPDDITPMKNPKKQKTTKIKTEQPQSRSIPEPRATTPNCISSTSTTSTTAMSTSNTKIDLSYHPDKDREWYYEDFKINPSKNQNLDYAYEVVLRGNSRKCVHGSTCKDCENFYKMAKGDQIRPIQMGIDWNSETRRENQNKKPNLIATTSRHRSIWGRVESPPGFRDFDFPDTQQQLKNKEKSNKLRLKKAYERLFSAINGGKYMFRDEKFNIAVREKNFVVDDEVFEKYININLDE